MRIKSGKFQKLYRLCDQTVTLYHWNGGDSIVRRVLRKNTFFDARKVQNAEKTGSREANGFLLVIPCREIPVAAGDKVLLGEGPDIAGREEWAGFIPSKVPGLVVVKWVDPKYWNGQLVHVEAGG